MTLEEEYNNQIVPEFLEKDRFSNRAEVPTVGKIVVNIGFGKKKDDLSDEQLEKFRSDLEQITGQRPNDRRARKSEAGWNLRKGDLVGMAVTLRGKKKWGFLEKLIKVALPRVRNFRGISTESFDGHGNLSIGLVEYTCFPEVTSEEGGVISGLEMTVVTSADNDEDGYLLLEKLGIPFAREE